MGGPWKDRERRLGSELETLDAHLQPFANVLPSVAVELDDNWLSGGFIRSIGLQRAPCRALGLLERCLRGREACGRAANYSFTVPSR